MAGYIVEAKLLLDDKVAYSSLTKLIGQMEKAGETVANLNKLLAETALGLGNLLKASGSLAVIFGDINKESGTLNTRLSNISTRSLSASEGIDKMVMAGSKSIGTMSAMTVEAEKLSLAMGGIGKAGRMGVHSAGKVAAAEEVGIMGAIGSKLFAGGLIGTAINTMIGFDVTKAALNPAMEYQQRFNSFKMLDKTPEGQRAAEESVRRTVELIPTTTFANNMQTYKELKGIFVHGTMASQMLPVFQKLKVAMIGATGNMPEMQGHEGEIAQTMARTAEMMGAANNPAQLTHFMDMFMRSFISSGTLAKPGAFAQAIKYMRSTRYGKNDEFLFGVLPYMVGEMSVGRSSATGGVGPMIASLSKMLQGGTMTKTVAEGLVKLGMLPPSALVNTQTIHTAIKNHKLLGWDILQQNPFEWATHEKKAGENGPDSMKERMAKHFKMTVQQFDALAPDKKVGFINQITGGAAQTAQDALMQFIIQEPMIRRHIELMKTIPGLEDQYNTALATTGMKLQETGAQFHNLFTILGAPVLTAMNPILDGTVKVMQLLIGRLMNLKKNFDELVKINPGLGKMLNDIATGLNAIGGAVNNFMTNVVHSKDPKVQDMWNRSVVRGAAGIGGAAVGTLAGPAAPVAIPILAGAAMVGADILMGGPNHNHHINNTIRSQHEQAIRNQGYAKNIAHMNSLLPEPPANITTTSPPPMHQTADYHLDQIAQHATHAAKAIKNQHSAKAKQDKLSYLNFTGTAGFTSGPPSTTNAFSGGAGIG